MGKVYCVGELLIDFVADNQGGQLSQSKHFERHAGGAPANVACAVSKMGGESVFLGCVGYDQFGTLLKEKLAVHGVDVSGLQNSDSFTTLAFVSRDKQGERDFVFCRGADKELKYDPKVKKGFKGNMVHLGAATALLGGSLEEAYGRYFFDALTQDTFISYDPNFRIDLWKGREKTFVKKAMPFLQKAQLCKFSIEEAQLLSGKSELEEAVQYFHGLGIGIVVITLGEKGSFVSGAGVRELVPSVVVEAIDTTGAGDGFVGCLLYQIARLENPYDILKMGKELLQMVSKANKMGALTATQLGGIPALPYREQIFGHQL